TLAVGMFFAARGFHLGFVDIGHDGYQLRQILDLSQGRVIFKDVFDQYGPLNGYVNSLFFVALGRRLLTLKYAIAGSYGVTAIVLFALARRLLDRWLATAAVLAWLGLAPFYNHGIMISPHAYVLLIQAIATLILVRGGAQVQPARYAAVGFLAGLSWA